MQVEIDDKRISIGNDSLTYYPYYFDIWADDKNTDRLTVVKSVIVQWAQALARSIASAQPLYLPYSLDDQEIDCIKATRQGNKVIFKCVEVHDNGYAIDLDKLDDFIFATDREVIEEAANDFGEYDAQEMIEALMNARVSAS